MGRNRGFDTGTVLAAAAAAFVSTGYEGTSVDDLLRATGLHRGSLYQAFGSKRGLFLDALRLPDDVLPAPLCTDLLLVALLDVAPHDEQIRHVAHRLVIERFGSHAAGALGDRLLARAGIASDARPHQVIAPSTDWTS